MIHYFHKRNAMRNAMRNDMRNGMRNAMRDFLYMITQILSKQIILK